jgi:hypothetical protein
MDGGGDALGRRFYGQCVDNGTKPSVGRICARTNAISDSERWMSPECDLGDNDVIRLIWGRICCTTTIDDSGQFMKPSAMEIASCRRVASFRAIYGGGM